ncbi:type IV toxin-antitoxin system AbiEi family antitoxin domain-containing protein [Trueperella pyogenes]|uniref:type IV toxin-antitoxin system AbiEi family antitoxin domain-containing protein n=1 Tax=Trueperella pyogenes TaxID=1661 RepID=UPI001901C902|nr:type IV toxin-antitoxin system AbiEi family antitoxin domain-containing protein [Trueperella pyogenes]
MGYSNHTGAIAELSESEGVFTSGQAARMGVPRDALHDAVASGRLERAVRGAYRMVGVWFLLRGRACDDLQLSPYQFHAPRRTNTRTQ